MKISEKRFSWLLRRAVREAGSQAGLARAAGMSPQMVGYVIKAQRKPSAKLLKFLGLRRVTMFERVG